MANDMAATSLFFNDILFSYLVCFVCLLLVFALPRMTVQKGWQGMLLVIENRIVISRNGRATKTTRGKGTRDGTNRHCDVSV
jgi:hypothetical protein